MSNDPNKGSLVEFLQDCAPYCKGDVVRLDDEAKKYVDARSRKIGLEGSVYKASKGTSTEEVTADGQQPVVAATAPAEPEEVVADNPSVEGNTVTNTQVTNDPKDKPKK